MAFEGSKGKVDLVHFSIVTKRHIGPKVDLVHFSVGLFICYKKTVLVPVTYLKHIIPHDVSCLRCICIIQHDMLIK